MLSIKEMILFAFLGTIMFVGKLIMEPIPNIHPLAMLTIAYTIAYKKKALWPINIYIILVGIYNGFFNPWWIGHVYVWNILWAITMILPKNLSSRQKAIMYAILSALHGLFYGVLWSPLQAIIFNLNFKSTLIWIVAGFPFDIIHSIGNFAMGILIAPLINTLNRLNRTYINDIKENIEN